MWSGIKITGRLLSNFFLILILMLTKIISAIIGFVAVGIFIWKFKETQLCRPWIMLAVAGGVGYVEYLIFKYLFAWSSRQWVFRIKVYPISLPAITVSISSDILNQLLVPIYNRSALQIVFGELIAVDRTSCHSSRIESFCIVDCVWQSTLLFKRASWRFRA